MNLDHLAPEFTLLSGTLYESSTQLTVYKQILLMGLKTICFSRLSNDYAIINYTFFLNAMSDLNSAKFPPKKESSYHVVHMRTLHIIIKILLQIKVRKIPILKLFNLKIRTYIECKQGEKRMFHVALTQFASGSLCYLKQPKYVNWSTCHRFHFERILQRPHFSSFP